MTAIRPNLSKSLYIKGLQCHKALLLMKTQKELRFIDETRQSVFEEGLKVGVLARKLYPNGRNIEAEAQTFPHRLKLTQSLLEDPTCTTLYEAAFQHENVFVMVDIMHKTKYGWELIEVKSSTTEKVVFMEDLSLQYFVLKGLGVQIRRVTLLHLNPHYHRKKTLSLYKLFKKIDLTKKVKKHQGTLHHNIAAMREALLTPLFTEALPIGPHCTHPYACDFMPHCWSHVPKYSIFNLSGIPIEEKFKLYDQGIVDIIDIPNTLQLSASGSFQKQAEFGEIPFNKKAIKEFLSSLYYPLYFMDFEAFQNAIPVFHDTKPYQQIPFQYSLHSLNSPFDSPTHLSFLAEPGKDPRHSFALALVRDIPENACVLVYDSGFEKLVIKQLAESFPNLAKPLMSIYNRVKDLMIPFQQHLIYVKEMKGSYSIKSILPALVPELTYSQLKIANGAMASKAYARLSTLKDPAIIEETKTNLLAYCEMDTYAMLKILEVLEKRSAS